MLSNISVFSGVCFSFAFKVVSQFLNRNGNKISFFSEWNKVKQDLFQKTKQIKIFFRDFSDFFQILKFFQKVGDNNRLKSESQCLLLDKSEGLNSTQILTKV